MTSIFASGRPALCEDVLENAPGELGLPGPGRPLDFNEIVPHFFRRRSGVERGAEVEIQLTGRPRHGAERSDRREFALLVREVVADEDVAKEVLLEERVDCRSEDLIARRRRNFRASAELRAHPRAVFVLVDAGGNGRSFPAGLVAQPRGGAAPQESPALPEEGPRELRSAANAFNRTREQIRGHLDERNRMIAALAHDLRTPLTKLQLRLARVEPETLRDQLAEPAKGLNAILTQGLEFARSLRTEEPMTKVDLPSFLQSLADDYADLGRAVTFECDSALEANPQTGILPARPLCLKRCMENLLTNACAYAGSAEIRLTAEKEALVVTVSDRGLGIPEELLEKVFEPYFRVEGSRNRASGGTGLGLAIARNMAQSNGAALSLANRPGGGLVVTLRFRRP